jgi:biotin transport system substrate-specific component
MGLYLAQGALGLPFFSGGSSGIELLGPASATGGYLWGFVAASFVVGRLAERGWDRSLWRAVFAMAVGEVVLYVIGVVWLSRALDVSIREAVRLGFTPFIVGDALKMLLAGVALPTSWGLVGRQTSRPRRGRT